jgi:hypothetical protein
VFGDQWLGEVEQGDEVVDGEFAAGEKVEDLPPPGLGYRVERVRRRRCSCHDAIVFP